MKMTGHTRFVLVAAMIGACAVCVQPAKAGLITDVDIVPTTGHEVGSGNGTLDLILFGFTGGGGVTDNEVTGFNGDDANSDMPTGGTSTMSGSYITSIGEIRDFYELTFPDGQGGSLQDQIVLFLDLSETGTVNHITLNTLTIVTDYDDFTAPDDRNDPLTNDISSATQNSTGAGTFGGTVIASLDPNIVPKSIPLNDQGAGHADHLIFTGINPFDQTYDDSTRILFSWDSTDHDNGGDKVFLSGSIIPEPSSMVLLAVGAGVGLFRRRRSRA